MRVLHLIPSLTRGGAERQLLQLVCEDGAARSHSIVTMMDCSTNQNYKVESGKALVTGLGMRRGVPSLHGLWRMCKLIRDLKPDVLHSWMYHANLLGLLAASLMRVPLLIWGIRCSDMDFSRYSALSRLVFRLNALTSDIPSIIVVNSRRGISFHSEMGFSTRRMTFIPNGIDTKKFKPDVSARPALLEELKCDKRALLVGHFARYDPMKDHETFLLAAQAIRRAVPRVHFVLAGDGVGPGNEALTALIRKHDLTDCMSLLGPRDDVPRLMAALDLFCSSSAFGEGFSNTLGEAMASGVACVATNVGDTEVILGEGGLVVPARRPNELAQECIRMLQLEPEARAKIGRSATERVIDRFGISKSCEEYSQMYYRLVTNRVSAKDAQ